MFVSHESLRNQYNLLSRRLRRYAHWPSARKGKDFRASDLSFFSYLFWVFPNHTSPLISEHMNTEFLHKHASVLNMFTYRNWFSGRYSHSLLNMWFPLVMDDDDPRRRVDPSFSCFKLRIKFRLSGIACRQNA